MTDHETIREWLKTVPPPKPLTHEEKERMADRMREAEEFAKKRQPRKKRSMWTGHGR